MNLTKVDSDIYICQNCLGCADFKDEDWQRYLCAECAQGMAEDVNDIESLEVIQSYGLLEDYW